MSPISAYLAGQLARPSGFVGRVFMTRLLNRRNRGLIRATLAELALTPDTRLLDVGFGGGLALRLAREQGVSRLTGLEPSPAAVEALERTSPRWLEGATLSLATGIVEHMPFGNAAFDAIMSTNTLYFWPDLNAAFGELRRVLAPGGRLALGFSSAARLRAMQTITRHGFLFHEVGELLERARQAGLADVRIVALQGRRIEGEQVLVASG